MNLRGHHTYRLVRSVRVDGKVRQRTLLNLGQSFELEHEQWPTLCSRLDELLGGQESLLVNNIPATIEQHAQKLFQRLLVQESEVTTKPVDSNKTGTDFQSVDLNSLSLVQPRSIGVEALGLWAMQQVGLEDKLRQLNFTGPQRAALIGSIIGRMAAPASELATYSWLQKNSGLGELLDFDYERMHLMQLYRASDQLMKHREAIEATLFEQVKNLFNLPCTITLYDLTNTYFEGEAGINPKAKRGHSKEKRSDCPLLTLGLVLDESGFVRSSKVFSGNVSEATTLEEMLKGLEASTGALVVMDRGIATEDNLSWLREHEYRYLVVSREQQRQFDPDSAVTIENSKKEKVHLQKVYGTTDQDVRLYCHSEQRAEKEAAMTQQFVDRFEAALTKLSEGLSRPRTTKKIDKLWERIGRIKAKSHGVDQHYQIEIIPTDNGINGQEIRWQRHPKEGTMMSHPGVYCLRSNETGWNEEQMWRTYIMLTDLEAVFRSLKSELGLRPIYHHKEERSDGHLFITVIAYQLVQLIRRKLAEQGNHTSWKSLRTLLAPQCRITATFNRQDGRTLHVRKTSQAEPAQLEIYQQLGLDPSPGGIKKMIV